MLERQERDEEGALERQVTKVETKVQEWWKAFYEDVFPLLIPRASMRHEHPNPSIGDIVLVKYSAKYSRATYRLARVVRLMHDAHGRVRTVEVWLRCRRRARGETPEESRAGVTGMLVPVQRTVLILPAAKQPPELIERLLGQLEGGEVPEVAEETQEEEPDSVGQQEAGRGEYPCQPAQPQGDNTEQVDQQPPQPPQQGGWSEQSSLEELAAHPLPQRARPERLAARRAREEAGGQLGVLSPPRRGGRRMRC